MPGAGPVDQKRITEVALLLAVALGLCAVVLWPVSFGGKVPAFGDNISFWAPNTHYWVSEVKYGRFPGWNPHIMCGVPFAADINHGLFYPPNWLALINDTSACLRLLVVLHVTLGMCGVYVFARGFNVAKPIAAWAGFAFGLCEAFLPLSNHVVMLESMSWAGFALRSAWSCASGGGAISFLGLAVFTALSALAGDIHATYMICVACGVLAVVRAGRFAAVKDFRAAGRAVLAPLAGMAAGMVLAAVSVVPAIELALLSERSAGGSSYSSYHSMDPKAILGWVLPNFFGSAREGTVWNFRAGNAVFVGLVTLAAGAVSLRKPLEALPLAAMFAAGVALSLGGYNPLWPWLQRLLPGLRYFRQPREFFAVAVLAAITLAAMQLSALYGRATGSVKSRRWVWKTALVMSAFACVGAAAAVIARDHVVRWLLLRALADYADGAPEIARRMVTSAAQAVLAASIAACALSAYMLGKTAGMTAAAVVCVVVLADFAVVSWGSLVFGPADLCSGRTAMADTLREESRGGHVRIVPAADGFGEYYEDYGSRRLGGRLNGEPAGMPTLLKVKSCLVDNEPNYAGVSSTLGYSTFITRRYAALWRASGASEISPVRLRYQGAGKYWLFGAKYALNASRTWDSCTRTRIDSADIRMAYHWQQAKTLSDAVTLVCASPERAYLAPVIEGIAFESGVPPLADVNHSVEGILRGTNFLTLRVFTDGAGMLYIPDCNYPGWQAWDNGAPARIYDANIAFRAVYLTGGKHEIEMRYSPRTLWFGAGVSAVGWTFAVIVGVAAFLGRKDE